MENLKEMVEHPEHYKGDGLEVYQVLESFFTPCETIGFYKGNVLKYVLRAGKKDDTVQDLKKAKWYLQKLIEKMEGIHENMDK